MKHDRVTYLRLRAVALSALLLFATVHQGATARVEARSGADALAEEIRRWSAFAKDNTAKDELWNDIKPAAETGLARARRALEDGQRRLALLRLASTRESLAAVAYVQGRPRAARTQLAAFEAEWARLGSSLGAAPGAAGATASPATTTLARALAEAAAHQTRVYYDASLDYGRSTQPELGLYYLGAAQAVQEWAALVPSLDPPSGRATGAPSLRGLTTELDSLEDDLLAIYRPPASIDRHGEFIAANGLLKVARELDAAGLRHGALLRYLQAALRVAPLRADDKPPASAAIARQLLAIEARLAAGAVDHDLARVFVEQAHAELTPATATTGPTTAAAIVNDALPRYFAALDPAPAAAPHPEPRATVTLVRWPYT